MSIGTELNTIMNASSTLNGLVSEICFERIPANYVNNITTNNAKYLFYTYRQNEIISALNKKDALRSYILYVSVICNNSVDIDTITNTTIEYLNGYSSNSGVRDISFLSDDHVTDFEKNIYQNTLEFNVYYED